MVKIIVKLIMKKFIDYCIFFDMFLIIIVLISLFASFCF